VDLVRAAAAFWVVFAHVSMNIVNYWDKKPLVRGDPQWWTTGLVYGFWARAALSLFFLISGYLLLSMPPTDIVTFLKRRLWKLLVPLVFWGAFYILWHGEYPPDFFKAVKFIARSIYTGDVEFHLWFFYAFLGLYLFVPILQIFLKSARESDVWYIVAVWFLVGPLASLAYMITGRMVAIGGLGYFSGFLGSFLLGYLLGKKEISRKWVIAGWILIPLTIAAETIYLYVQTDTDRFMNDAWFDSLAINVVFYTFWVYIVLKDLGIRIQNKIKADSKLPIWLEKLSRLSFGVILIHILVREVMYEGIAGFHLAPYDFHPIISIPIVAIVMYAISCLLVAVMQRIPILRYVVPS
jgi:surface polysaccharide O-acyltransferase-like enzyme